MNIICAPLLFKLVQNKDKLDAVQLDQLKLQSAKWRQNETLDLDLLRDLCRTLISDGAKRFFVYVDFTADRHTPFYVGKGDAKRIKNFKRGPKHKNVSKKHGIERLVIFETTDESEAFEYEKLLIAKLHTFKDDPEAPDIACNFTIGGEGGSGFRFSLNAEAKAKISASKRGRKRPPFSDEAKAKMSKSAKNRPPISEEHRAKMSVAAKNRSAETKAKMSEASHRRWERCHAEKAQQNV